MSSPARDPRPLGGLLGHADMLDAALPRKAADEDFLVSLIMFDLGPVVLVHIQSYILYNPIYGGFLKWGYPQVIYY